MSGQGAGECEGHTAGGERWVYREGASEVAAIGEDGASFAGDIVCEAPEGWEDSMAHWPRRARLIAAAPTLLAERDEARAERDAALRECSKYARQAGEAQGRLEGSELAGVVDGWRERATAAEAALAREKARADEASAALAGARQYVVDALEAYEHSDGRELLGRIDVALSLRCSALSSAKGAGG